MHSWIMRSIVVMIFLNGTKFSMIVWLWLSCEKWARLFRLKFVKNSWILWLSTDFSKFVARRWFFFPYLKDFHWRALDPLLDLAYLQSPFRHSITFTLSHKQSFSNICSSWSSISIVQLYYPHLSIIPTILCCFRRLFICSFLFQKFIAMGLLGPNYSAMIFVVELFSNEAFGSRFLFVEFAVRISLQWVYEEATPLGKKTIKNIKTRYPRASPLWKNLSSCRVRAWLSARPDLGKLKRFWEFCRL